MAASSQALSSIDISSHEGNHPRKGSVDLIPIHPITENTNLEDCGKIAVDIGSELKLRHPDLSVFYFGHADLPKKRDLVQRRKEVGWFEKDEKNPKSKSGLTGIGAIPYMSNFNVMINCSDIKIGHKIAKSIRERNGGLLGVQSMAFVHGQDQIEIACNVDLIHNPKDKTDLSQIFGSYYMTPFQTIYDEIQKLTEENNCSMKGDSVIIGFTPKELGRITQECLNSGETWAVGKFKRSM